jgi:hypothetical protein
MGLQKNIFVDKLVADVEAFISRVMPSPRIELSDLEVQSRNIRHYIAMFIPSYVSS